MTRAEKLGAAMERIEKWVKGTAEREASIMYLGESWEIDLMAGPYVAGSSLDDDLLVALEEAITDSSEKSESEVADDG